MAEGFWLYMFVLYAELSFVVALYMFLKHNCRGNVYVLIFLWIINPLLWLYGLLFMSARARYIYFSRLKKTLLINTYKDGLQRNIKHRKGSKS
jgi:hypothetical protein